MRIDLHCHSEASPDCRTPLRDLPDLCLAAGIAVQAITDHDRIWGAVKLQEIVAERGLPLTVIVGEEVMTAEGEIIGLFLRDRVEPGLSAEETVEAIHGQGGLVLIPHGFDPMKRYRLRREAVERLADRIDIVEGFNARISHPRWNEEAIRWAQARGIPRSAGSDSHRADDVGCAWVEVPDREIRTPADLLEALQGRSPTGTWTHPALSFMKKVADRLTRRAAVRRPPPEGP